MWITAQGRFSDVRERPLALRPGVARLAELAPEALFVPLALDYAFWEERGAEACLAFGRAFRPATSSPCPAGPPRPPGGRPDRHLDRLALDVRSRDPARFASCSTGAAASAASTRPGTG